MSSTIEELIATKKHARPSMLDARKRAQTARERKGLVQAITRITGRND